MAYLANKREITADPGERKVAIFKIPEKKNPYFSTPMNIVRWQVLEGLIMNKLLFAALLTVAFCTSYALAVDKHYNFEDTEYQAQNLDVRGIAESPEAFLKRVKPLVENESFAADVEKELTVISVPKIVFKETALSDAVEQLNQLMSVHNSKRNIFQIPLVRIEPSPPSETTRPSGTKDGQQERITLQLSDVSMKGLIQYIANLTNLKLEIDKEGIWLCPITESLQVLAKRAYLIPKNICFTQKQAEKLIEAAGLPGLKHDETKNEQICKWSFNVTWRILALQAGGHAIPAFERWWSHELLTHGYIANDLSINASPFPSYSLTLANFEDWKRLLNDYTEELKTLKDIPTVPNSPDFQKTRRSMLCKYINLYFRVCETTRKHDAMGPYKPTENAGLPFDKIYSGQILISGMFPGDIKDPSTRKAYEEAIERNHLIAQHSNYERDLENFKQEVCGALGGYCGYAFKTDEKEDLNAIIKENVSNFKIRKRLQDGLGLTSLN